MIHFSDKGFLSVPDLLKKSRKKQTGRPFTRAKHKAHLEQTEKNILGQNYYTESQRQCAHDILGNLDQKALTKKVLQGFEALCKASRIAASRK